MNILNKISKAFKSAYLVHEAPKNLRQCFSQSVIALFTVLIVWMVTFSFLGAGFFSVILKNLWLLLVLITVASQPYIQYYTRNDLKQQKKD